MTDKEVENLYAEYVERKAELDELSKKLSKLAAFEGHDLVARFSELLSLQSKTTHLLNKEIQERRKAK